jgi:hypothetical protein
MRNQKLINLKTWITKEINDMQKKDMVGYSWNSVERLLPEELEELIVHFSKKDVPAYAIVDSGNYIYKPELPNFNFRKPHTIVGTGEKTECENHFILFFNKTEQPLTDFVLTKEKFKKAFDCLHPDDVYIHFE